MAAVAFLAAQIDFNPRSYKRSDYNELAIARFGTQISIHAPTRGATDSPRCRKSGSGYFNPRSYKRSDGVQLGIDLGHVDFNPRSYKRSDGSTQIPFQRESISIHAPTRGATVAAATARNMVLISIHAPTRGATSYPATRGSRILFQSTLLQEERQAHSQSYDAWIRISIHAPTRGATDPSSLVAQAFAISIHAPTRGATGYPDPTPCEAENFNPRSYKRSDGSTYCVHVYGNGFQSTLLQEERQQKCTIFLMHLCNNYCIVSI